VVMQLLRFLNYLRDFLRLRRICHYIAKDAICLAFKTSWYVVVSKNARSLPSLLRMEDI